MTEVAADNTPLIQTDKSKGKKSTCPRFNWKEIRERKLNLRTFLLVLCMVSTIMTYAFGGSIVVSITTLPDNPSCFDPVFEAIPYANLVQPIILNHCVIALMYLISGMLADTIIGRGKVIMISLWCCWLGSMLYIVSFCIQYGLCGGLSVNIAKYGILALALILILFGTSSSLANIAPYGQDQLVNKSSCQIRAFIHWLIWGMYLGLSFNFMFSHDILYQPELVLTISLVVFLFNSIVLILFGIFNHKFKPSGVLKKNPYKSIYEVLKYAVQHKSPTNRSAMTYWEHTAPSRIDLGKEKYGGPFTEDEVEDVKVFWRIFGIIASTFGLHFPILVVVEGIFNYMNTFNYTSYLFWTIFNQSILLIVPVMHFIVIPLVPKIDYFLIKSLRNIGSLYILMIIAIISLIVISLVKNTTYYLCAIPLFFPGLVGSLRYTFTLEFIISQSPANMSGILMTAFWSLQAIFISIGTFVKLPFVYLYTDGPGKLSDNFWVFLINLLVLIVGFVVYIVCAWKYKKRQRDDGYYYHNVIEDTYGRMLDREEMINSNSITVDSLSDNS